MNALFAILTLTFLFLQTPAYAAPVVAEEADLIELGIDPNQEIEITASDATSAIVEKSNEPEEVKETELKLAGRGFIHKKTGESLALACVGINAESGERTCDSIRMVYFNPATKKAYYVGDTYEIRMYVPEKKAKHMNADEQRQYAIKRMMKDFKRWRKNQGGMSEDAKTVIQTGAFMGVLVLEWVATTMATGGASLAIAGATYPFYLVLTPIITGDIKLMNGNGRISSASYDQNGWNWSSQPAALRGKTFDLLMSYFSNDRHSGKENPIRQGVSQ